MLASLEQSIKTERKVIPKHEGHTGSHGHEWDGGEEVEIKMALMMSERKEVKSSVTPLSPHLAHNVNTQGSGSQLHSPLKQFLVL